MKRLFALPFENITNRNANTGYYFPSMPLISISRENTIETSLASKNCRVAKFYKVDA